MSGSKKFFIDTNIFLRYFVKEEKQAFKDCLEFFDKIKNKKITAVTSAIVLLEINYVLIAFYKYPKDKACEIIASIINLPGLKFINDINQLTAIELYKEKNVKFADCLIASILLDKADYLLVSYDHDFDKLGLKRLEPKEILTGNV